MIPCLPLTEAPGAATAAFLEALRAAGFEGELSTADGDRTVLATDNSIYRLVPQAIAFPRGTADLACIGRLLAEPRFAGVRIAPRGGGTGTNGQSLTDGLVVDVSRHMNRILEINAEARWVRVEAGVVKDQLNAALAPYGLFFAPELSTSNRATIGGMVSTDASGQGSCLYGKTRDHVLELTTVLADGTVWHSHPLHDEDLRAVQRRADRIGAIHRAVDAIEREHREEITARFPRLNRCLTGYDLAHIRTREGRFDLNAVLCGSEGTLGILAEAKLNVLPIPKRSALVNLRYASFDAALRDAQALMEFGPASIETVDSKVLILAQQDIVWEGVREFFPDDASGPARGVNLIEFVGDAEAEVEAPLQRLTAALAEAGPACGRLGHTIARGEAAVRRVWEMRKRAVGLLGNMQGEKRPIPFVEDTAVPPEHLADYIAEFRGLLDARGLDYGMFGHVDAGVLHVRPAIDMKDPAQAAMVREVTDAVVGLTRKYGGLLWGEHGKGVRSEYSPTFFGPLYPLVQAVKAAFDPRNQLNPGKIATPDGSALLTVDGVPTRGQADRSIPAGARIAFDEAMHCNGNGACYDWDPDAAMCPSWKATRDRRHSPKGRAMLVKEWLRRLAEAGADPVEQTRRLRGAAGWRSFPARLRNTLARRRGEADFSHQVKEAMDGCLACKSCVGGCPIKVNVPGFRAKFLELYHGRYLRPPRDHLVGTLEHLLPAMARVPRLANAVAAGTVGRAVLRRLGLVDTPGLSGIDLRAELSARGVALATPEALRALAEEERRRAVILVQDAFTTHYETRLVLDVLDLLRLLGASPWLAPFRPNGKALHVHGFLGAFGRVAAANAAGLQALAETGVALVGIDPSMTLTYRAEYAEVLGGRNLPQVLLLQEWLARQEMDGPRAAPAHYRLLPHCTERTTATASLRDWQSVFTRHGLRLEVLAAGCCGMAGTYGHEAEHRDTSERIYGLSWRHHVTSEGQAGHLLATGYSCRSQVKRFDEVALPHPAQALLHALRRQVTASA
ncbi:D-2-hydroxyglutarate dehydrogenase YdiJ [Paracraurococcus lichenis]|uniref:FAD-binding and (Fe-S)-binding domain-containing protein n=1 Tax=Paracraurococcus lichenis TaxID=3064888 RepID=A0ABT9E9Z8_9PROT|nr:FAD-binding and (Fe-S)-binding domain-containing protein [Paracraurococcus sp. LOR1-02]MDO9712793.1 FAD-binding and (Fe-S)-binding domain-containing protein [Paracraurococcus sp. LOR1-02]